MVLGTLQLQQPRGLFYHEDQLHVGDSFTNLEMEELTTMSKVFSKLEKLPEQYQLTPIDESENIDYITVTFEDNGQASYPYEVTVWLLIEEAT